MQGTSTTASRLIALAVSLLGDAAQVRDRLKCSEAEFLQYSAGNREMEWPEMDRLIRLVLDEQESLMARNRELLAQALSKLEQGPGRV